jgi:selenocysteine-specific translation elongation factor
VLTKCDLVGREELAKRVVMLRRELGEALPHDSRLPVLMVSAGRVRGLTELKAELAALFPRPGRNHAS